MDTLYQRNIKETTQGGILKEKITEQDSLDSRVGQLEVRFDFLKQKTENDHSVFTEKVNNSLELRKWVLISIVGIIGVFIAGAVFTVDLVKDSLDSSRNVQSEYYKLLLNNNQTVENSIQSDQLIKNCLKSKEYWEYSECFN